MADCCAELKSELAALRAEVAKLKPVDEESIINRAVVKTSGLLSPDIFNATNIATGAASAANVAKGVADFAKTEAYQATTTSRSAALAADYAQKIANGAVDVSELASIKAGAAKAASDALGKVAVNAERAALEAQVTANGAKVVADGASVASKVAQGAADAAAGVAAAANAFAASALGKAVLALGQILTLAGSVAGLFALYATLEVVFPRLDAHDRELQMIESQLAKDSTSISTLTFKVRAAQATADQANDTANKANDSAYNANIRISNLIPKVDEVIGKVDKIEPQVKDTAAKVEVLTPKVNDANSKANDAIGKANTATEQATIAQNKANDSVNKANDAIAKANDAISKIAILGPKVDEAQKTADYAFDTAITIKPIALDALQEAKETRPISEDALAKAFVSLNEVRAVAPVARDALTATQLQATQLQGTQLTVTKLGTVTSSHTSQIQLNTNDISNLKNQTNKVEQKLAAPPAPIKTPPPAKTPSPDELQKMNDKQYQDLQKQINTAIAGLAIAVAGVTAVANRTVNNTSPQALQNAAAAGTCRTTQPGGCMSNLVAPVANNAAAAAGNSANNSALLASLSALINAIQSRFLGPILEGVQLINKNFDRFSEWVKLDRLLNILTFITSFHNAYMLSSGLTQTLFSLVDNGVRLIIPTGPDGKPFSASEQFGISVNSLANSLLGESTADGIKKDWVKLNRIYQAGANIIGSFQSIMSSFQSTVDTIGTYTGQIGNSLKRFGVVGERAYGWMSENMNTRTRWLDRLEATIGTAQEITTNADTVASNLLSIKDTVTQLKTQQTEFDTAIKAIEPKPKVDNVPVQTKNDADKAQAQSATITLPDLDKPDV